MSDADDLDDGAARKRLRGAVDGLMSPGRVAARGGARGAGAATYVGQDLGHAPGPAFAAGPRSTRKVQPVQSSRASFL